MNITKISLNRRPVYRHDVTVPLTYVHTSYTLKKRPELQITMIQQQIIIVCLLINLYNENYMQRYVPF